MIAPPVDEISELKPKLTAALRTVSTPALAEPPAEPQARAGPAATPPNPLRARAGALAVRCASPSRLLPTLRVCCWLFVPAMRSTRRRTARHGVPSVSSRGAVWCGTHAVGRGRLGARSCASRADRFVAYGFAPPPPLRGCWRGVRVVCSVPCSGADFVVSVVTAFLPHFAGVTDRWLFVSVVFAGAASRHRRRCASSPVSRRRPPSRTLRALTTRRASVRNPKSPCCSRRCRHACGALSMRELASLRSAVPAIRVGGVIA